MGRIYIGVGLRSRISMDRGGISVTSTKEEGRGINRLGSWRRRLMCTTIQLPPSTEVTLHLQRHNHRTCMLIDFRLAMFCSLSLFLCWTTFVVAFSSSTHIFLAIFVRSASNVSHSCHPSTWATCL